MLLGGGRKLHVALGIAGDLRGVEALADLLDEGVTVAVVSFVGALQQGAGPHPRVFQGRQAAGVDGLGDQRARHAEVESQLAHPLPGPLGAGLVEDAVDDEVTAVGILDGEDVAGDLDQVAVEFAAVPVAEDFGQFGVGESGAVLEQRVGLADQLHVAVLNPVVHHLHVVAGTAWAHPVAAGDVALGADLGRDRLEDWLHERPGCLGPARHQARPLQRPLLAPGDAGAYVEQARRLHLLRPPFGIGEEGVATVDDHVPVGEERDERLDEVVDRRAGLHHHHHLPRGLERRDEILERVAADDVGLLAAAGREGVGDAGRTIEDRDREAPAGDVECQILAHDGQPDQTDVARRLLGHPANAPAEAAISWRVGGRKWEDEAVPQTISAAERPNQSPRFNPGKRKGLKDRARRGRLLGMAGGFVNRGASGQVCATGRT